MKKIYSQIVTFWVCGLLLLGIASCKKGGGFLAQTSTTDLNQTSVFADSARTAGFLANIYSNVGFSASATRFVYDPLGKKVICGGLDAACDESEPSHAFSTTASAFATGTVNAGIVDDGPYKTCYSNIRSVNQFLKNLPSSPIKAPNKALMVAEARFLRAWYYAILLKHYAGVPLVGDSLFTYETPINVKRSTYAQCVDYITSECDAAAQVLPLVQTGADYGRASKGACLALKARVLLYAASPLFNGTTLVQDAGGNADPALVGYPVHDNGLWKKAEDAAAVLVKSVYSLNTLPPKNVDASAPGAGFQGLFPQRENSEYIFEFMRPGNSDLENLFLPPSRNGANGAFPYQGLVDAFPMSNGKLITDPTSGYNSNDPYANRDPRLNYSITHDQSIMLVRLGNGTVDGVGPVNIFIGSYNGNVTGQDAVRQGTPTGYYCNKMLDPAATSSSLQFNTSRVIPLMRYAEVLLNYAEAANEYEGPTNNVYDVINSIRKRAGLNPFQLPSGLSKDEMRKYIQNERRIELAYEEHRFWDVRRWKIAGETENIQAQGMEVRRNGTSVTYNKFNVTKHNFRAAMYLWPFPLSETGKSPSLVQNPGY
ncbi:RagB/SusD family nutrient uptake outer membrane protein [Mucilaginibacter sabulilitoris]|uniref:RagB/SusD family nutrient uptake outer membrane protein n=1 Tax=Mucilaginibacter sabulilitoris TaxID=1173583 RepID=A0ABZ0TTG0_9SPHI|nr:RagB/SusD family nutrient uptake outer membrane protein [Mucilaginibacter sabulilitoris]WPU96386.1 RagB/SusD family nutrient uptake outer membrane protein [Mucilaginibacter sabulilitoris]